MLFLSKIFFSDTTEPIETKFGMDVPWDILRRTVVGNFDSLKTWLPLLKIECRGQTVDF